MLRREVAAHEANAAQALRIMTFIHRPPRRAPLFSAAKFSGSATPIFYFFLELRRSQYEKHSLHLINRTIPDKVPATGVKVPVKSALQDTLQ